MKKTLLAYRDWSGVGDWIMTLSVLKMVNNQYPNIDIHLNSLAKNNFTVGCEGQYTPLPTVVQQMIKTFDIKIDKFEVYENIGSNINRYKTQYDYVSGHMVYKKGDGQNFIDGMVREFNKNTGLDLKYEPDTFATYQEQGYDNSYDTMKPYVLIQSCSKRKEKERRGKDYGYDNMCHITDILSLHTTVIQIGQGGDYLIPQVSRFMSCDLEVLHNLMINCMAFIGMDGGLGVYASHHKVKHYIIYEEAKRFSWTNFPYRVQLNGELMGAGEVGDFIINDLRKTNEKSFWKDNLQIS